MAPPPFLPLTLKFLKNLRTYAVTLKSFSLLLSALMLINFATFCSSLPHTVSEVASLSLSTFSSATFKCPSMDGHSEGDCFKKSEPSHYNSLFFNCLAPMPFDPISGGFLLPGQCFHCFLRDDIKISLIRGLANCFHCPLIFQPLQYC